MKVARTSGSGAAVGGFMSTAGKVYGAFPGLVLFSGAGENQ